MHQSSGKMQDWWSGGPRSDSRMMHFFYYFFSFSLGQKAKEYIHYLTTCHLKKNGICDSHNSREWFLLNFILLFLYIIIIFAWFIAVHQSHYRWFKEGSCQLLAKGCALSTGLGAVARSEACPLGMQASPRSIPTFGTFFRGDLVTKKFQRPLFRWFMKSSCQLLAKECALSTGKLPRRLAQEQCV